MSVVGVRWAMAVLAAASSCVAAVDRPHDCTARHAKYGNNTMREEQTAESVRSRATGQVLTLPMGLCWAERRVVRGPQGPPCSSAPDCRAKIGGAADPATSPVSSPGRHHVILPPRHHTWRGFRRAMAIGAAKSVTFEKKQC